MGGDLTDQTFAHAQAGDMNGGLRQTDTNSPPADKLLRQDRPIVAVCHAGMRSGQATVILRGGGFERVANMRGGMLLWSQLVRAKILAQGAALAAAGASGAGFYLLSRKAMPKPFANIMRN